MDTASDIKLTCLMDRMRDKHHERSFFWRGSEFAKAVELVVDVVEPKIRVVSRYNKQLRGPVETAWQYLDSLIDQIPGEMRFSKRRYGIDPRVRVIFNNAASMLKTFNDSPVLVDFFHEHQDAQDSYVFLSMEKKEKSFLGMELAGDMLKRDVLQTAVSFSDHHLLTPALTEQGAKEGIKCCAFEGLLNKARQIIMAAHIKTRQLEESKQRITADIRHLRSELAKQPSSDPVKSASLERLQHKLQNVEQDFAVARMETESPNRHLQILSEVLSHPQHYLSVKHEVLNVNNLGILQSGESGKKALMIEIAEMEVAQSLKRVAMVASFPRRDLS